MSVSMEKARIDHQVLTPICSRPEPDRNTLAEYQIHLATFFGISVPECLGRCVGTHPEKLWVKIPNYFCLSAYQMCERQGRPQEALAYNSLVIAWPEIVRFAVGRDSAIAQTDLFA